MIFKLFIHITLKLIFLCFSFIFLFRIQELANARLSDRQSLQQTERKLGEERRQKQSLDSLLTKERIQRRQVEEKAARYSLLQVGL